MKIRLQFFGSFFLMSFFFVICAKENEQVADVRGTYKEQRAQRKNNVGIKKYEELMKEYDNVIEAFDALKAAPKNEYAWHKDALKIAICDNVIKAKFSFGWDATLMTSSEDQKEFALNPMRKFLWWKIPGDLHDLKNAVATIKEVPLKKNAQIFYEKLTQIRLICFV